MLTLYLDEDNEGMLGLEYRVIKNTKTKYYQFSPSLILIPSELGISSETTRQVEEQTYIAMLNTYNTKKNQFELMFSKLVKHLEIYIRALDENKDDFSKAEIDQLRDMYKFVVGLYDSSMGCKV